MIVLLLGVTGLIGKVMRWLPLPIVMGMIGGCMLKFGTQIVTGINTLPIVCGLAVLAFLLVPRVIKGFPGVLAALVVGVIAAIVTNSFAGEVGELVYTPPMLVVPQFNPNLILSCSCACSLGSWSRKRAGNGRFKGPRLQCTGQCNDSSIRYRRYHFRPSGCAQCKYCRAYDRYLRIGGGWAKEGRYASLFWNGVTFAAFGLVGSFTIAFVSFIPSELVNVLAGLAMLNVLIQAFNEGFGTLKYKRELSLRYALAPLASHFGDWFSFLGTGGGRGCLCNM